MRLFLEMTTADWKISFVLVGISIFCASHSVAVAVPASATPDLVRKRGNTIDESRHAHSGARRQRQTIKPEKGALLPSAATAPIPGTTSHVLTGRCVSVLNGDTLMFLLGETSVTIHLYAIDAPEKTQPFGREAKSSLWELAFGQTVTFYPAPEQNTDSLVGWVFAGKMGLNAEQVRQGFAWWDRYNAPGESKIVALESAARSARLGLWQNKTAVAPWIWRAASTNERVEMPMRTLPEKP